MNDTHDTTALVRMDAQPITVPEEIALVRDQWIAGKRAELAQAETVAAALAEMYPNGGRRLTRARDRVALLGKVVRALEHGYLPIPRFFGGRLTDVEELPAKAIVALAVAERAALFDEVRFIRGEMSTSRRGQSRRAARDPLLVGVVRMPARRYATGVAHWPEETEPGREEHFLLAWWRPEDERDETMF